MIGPDSFTDFERNLLRAVDSLKDNAYGMTIRQALQRHSKTEIAIGTVYAAIERLEEAGLVSTHEGETVRGRGGIPKTMVTLEEAGRRVMIKSVKMVPARRPAKGLKKPESGTSRSKANIRSL